VPPLGEDGGWEPPVPGSGVPPPPVPPVLPLPVLGGVCGVADGAGAGVAGVPPLPELGVEPDEPELPPEESLDLSFFDELGVVVEESVGIGDVVLGSNV
jgi:hypothetical protein